MTPRLYVVQDDLFFAERVRAGARRLGLALSPLTRAEAAERRWDPGSVVVIQVTLHSDRQLDLIEAVTRAEPAPTVVAVTGHLETELRARAKALGVTLAAHSSLDRAIARAMGLSDGRGDADGGNPSR